MSGGKNTEFEKKLHFARLKGAAIEQSLKEEAFARARGVEAKKLVPRKGRTFKPYQEFNLGTEYVPPHQIQPFNLDKWLILDRDLTVIYQQSQQKIRNILGEAVNANVMTQAQADRVENTVATGMKNAAQTLARYFATPASQRTMVPLPSSKSVDVIKDQNAKASYIQLKKARDQADRVAANDSSRSLVYILQDNLSLELACVLPPGESFNLDRVYRQICGETDEFLVKTFNRLDRQPSALCQHGLFSSPEHCATLRTNLGNASLLGSIIPQQPSASAPELERENPYSYGAR